MQKEFALPLPTPILKTPLSFADQTEAAGRAPRIKRTPTFSDAHVNDTAYKRPGTSEDTRLSKSLTLSSTGDGQQKTNSTVSRGAETQARAWEEAEMTKIKKRLLRTSRNFMYLQRTRCRF